MRVFPPVLWSAPPASVVLILLSREFSHPSCGLLLLHLSFSLCSHESSPTSLVVCSSCTCRSHSALTRVLPPVLWSAPPAPVVLTLLSREFSHPSCGLLLLHLSFSFCSHESSPTRLVVCSSCTCRSHSALMRVLPPVLWSAPPAPVVLTLLSREFSHPSCGLLLLHLSFSFCSHESSPTRLVVCSSCTCRSHSALTRVLPPVLWSAPPAPVVLILLSREFSHPSCGLLLLHLSFSFCSHESSPTRLVVCSSCLCRSHSALSTSLTGDLRITSVISCQSPPVCSCDPFNPVVLTNLHCVLLLRCCLILLCCRRHRGSVRSTLCRSSSVYLNKIQTVY